MITCYSFAQHSVFYGHSCCKHIQYLILDADLNAPTVMSVLFIYII